MPIPTHTLWPVLPPQLANDILLSVQKSSKKLYRTAAEVMAPRMGIRLPTLMEMPKSQRHVTWIRILARPEMEVLSFNILSTWLIEEQRALLCAWLDALGIEHAENGCADTFPPQPEPPVLQAGIDTILAGFDPVIVAVYLRCFNQIDETHWPALEHFLHTDPRLQLHAPQRVNARAVAS